MQPIDLNDVCAYVNENIEAFHNHRVAILSKLTLNDLISKNPYLFRAKNITKASELIEGTLTAFLSSSEEKLFGDFLENLAIYIASQTTGGWKSSAPGMDLEYVHKNIHHIVSIKSGPSWGNSSQHGKLKDDFANAERRLRQSQHVSYVQKILGICYGKAKTALTSGGYIKVVGQNFWTLISGDKNLYIKIIEPVGYRAREHNDVYAQERGRITNRLTKSFIDTFCIEDGSIDWSKLLKANSGNFDIDQFFSSEDYSG